MTGISDPIRGATEATRCWTLTNVSEATPDVLSPLCWSVWSESVELGARGAWFDFGILPGREVRHSHDPNRMITACFFGRQAMNVDLCRTLMAGIPGTTADDFERDILGSVRPDAPPVPDSWRRLPFIAAKTPVVLATQSRRIRRLHDEQAAWWRAQVLDRSPAGDPQARLAEGSRRFQEAMRLHVRTRFLVQGLQSQVVVLATQAGVPELAARLLGGMGNVAETALADDIWLVGRGQLERAEFLRRHGYHGTNEGNVIGRSWREEPAVVDTLVQALAARPDDQRPRARETEAMADRQEAEAELGRRLPRHRRAAARLLCRLTGAHIRNLEMGKGSFLMAVDGCRSAARDLGAELVAAGVVDEIDDVFYFTVPELVEGPGADAREVVAFRKARREEYRKLDLPVTFTGMPEPVAAATDTGGDDDVVTGAPGSAGVVEGRARVVLEPGEATLLEPGEVLVCRYTDPSWSPLMVLADALVIDIGGPASHGAIVARELGIPCVIGTGNGTTRLHTGDRLRVDGAAGVVEVLARMESS